MVAGQGHAHLVRAGSEQQIEVAELEAVVDHRREREATPDLNTVHVQDENAGLGLVAGCEGPTDRHQVELRLIVEVQLTDLERRATRARVDRAQGQSDAAVVADRSTRGGRRHGVLVDHGRNRRSARRRRRGRCLRGGRRGGVDHHLGFATDDRQTDADPDDQGSHFSEHEQTSVNAVFLLRNATK